VVGGGVISTPGAPMGFKSDHSVPYVGGRHVSSTWRTHDVMYGCEDCEWWSYRLDKSERHERRTAKNGQPHHVGAQSTL
jgi:hypothetical protein